MSITLHPWVRSAIRGTNPVIQAHGWQGTDSMVPSSFLIRLFGDECRFRMGSLACQSLLEILGHRTRCEIRSSDDLVRVGDPRGQPRLRIGLVRRTSHLKTWLKIKEFCPTRN